MTYKEMYIHLYGRITDALDWFYEGNTIMGMYMLEKGIFEIEEMAMEMDIIPDKP